MKRYLAFYGDNYYPHGGMNDFVGSYDTLDEAKDAVQVEHIRRTNPPHKWKGSDMWAHIFCSKHEEDVCAMHGGLKDWKDNA
jgi:hypothetical protein